MMQMREIAAWIYVTNAVVLFTESALLTSSSNTGMYKNVLVIGAEVHSHGLDYTDKGRNVSVIFGDGSGAVVLQLPPKTVRAF
jgi:3-oxoacyl-[acyl-carrier-protein] synthase-3